jgi:hypothetical protein
MPSNFEQQTGGHLSAKISEKIKKNYKPNGSVSLWIFLPVAYFYKHQEEFV